MIYRHMRLTCPPTALSVLVSPRELYPPHPNLTPALMTLLSPTCANCPVPFARDSPQHLCPLYMFVAAASLRGLSVCWMLDVSDHMNFLIGDNKVGLEPPLMGLLVCAGSVFLRGPDFGSCFLIPGRPPACDSNSIV